MTPEKRSDAPQFPTVFSVCFTFSRLRCHFLHYVYSVFLNLMLVPLFVPFPGLASAGPSIRLLFLGRVCFGTFFGRRVLRLSSHKPY